MPLALAACHARGSAWACYRRCKWVNMLTKSGEHGTRLITSSEAAGEMSDNPSDVRPKVQELDDWPRSEPPSWEDMRLQLRVVSVLIALVAGFVLSGLSFAHGCLRGSRLIEATAPYVGGIGCGLFVLCIRRIWVGVVLAAGLLALICWVLAPWYMAWAHGRLGCST
jgi:hypothetical protein